MTDRELLEFAAKAAGVNYEHQYQTPDGVEFAGLLLDHGYANYPPVFWNPLTDDGDALRLAVKKSMSVRVNTLLGVVEVSCGDGPVGNVVRERLGGDHAATTRRAIVRAAAEIGKAMP